MGKNGNPGNKGNMETVEQPFNPAFTPPSADDLHAAEDMGLDIETVNGPIDVAAMIATGGLKLADIFGQPEFLRPTKDTWTKTKDSQLVARIMIPVAGVLIVEATAWCRTKETEGYIERDISVGFGGRSVNFNDKIGGLLDQWTDYKTALLADGGPLDLFLFPNGDASSLPRSGDGARLVKRIAVKAKVA